MVDALFMMGGLGLIVGLCLAVASKVFYVFVDPKIEAVEAALPGANCGGCGLPGCGANAEAIVAGKASPASCVAGGTDLAFVIADIMGVSVEAKEPDIARPGCFYGVADADLKYQYTGLNDCRAAALLNGGMKVCSIGCLGLGTCAQVCPFDAITMGEYGLPVVDEVRCTGCGTCERVCPKHIITLSSVTRRIMREYTTDECTTPCQRSCPAGINIREYIIQIARGNYHRAVQVIKERNPFPAVIGRICPRPCELDCRRKYIDEPVAINYLKRFAADYEQASGRRIQPYKAPATGRKIAVVGAGVEGLSTAYFSARLGHDLTVFETADKPGGLLRSAIARNRLSPEVLDQDIAGIVDMGVDLQTDKTLGKDFTIASLLDQGFESVFLAAGGWDSRLARNPLGQMEAPIPGTLLMLDTVKIAAANDAGISCTPEVVIVGGGKLSLETVRACKKSGARQITVLFRESWDESPVTDQEVTADKMDDVQFIFNAAVTHIFGHDNQLTEIEYADLASNATNRIPAGTLILASGRFPEMIFSRPKAEATAQPKEAAEDDGLWQGAIPYKRPDQYDEVGLLSEKDVLSDYSAAIKAIGAGRRAAASIHQLIYGIEPPLLPEKIIKPESVLQNVDHVENVNPNTRYIMPLADGQTLDADGELEIGFDEETARGEAARCLQCGLICYKQSPVVDIAESAPVPA